MSPAHANGVMARECECRPPSLCWSGRSSFGTDPVPNFCDLAKPARWPGSQQLGEMHMHPLKRLLPLVHEHWLAFWGGMALICVGRVFEAGVPLMVRLSINRITAHDARLTYPVVVILGLAAMRYLAVAWGRNSCARLA